MKLQITRGRLFATTMIAGVATFAAFAANAQTAPAPAAQAAPADNEVEAVVVTGSLLRRTDAETPSPVTVQTQAQLEQRGITSVADAIRTLAADNSGSIPTAFGNGFAAGSSGVALRGLSVNSTLVLIDGERTANYPLADDGQKGFVDLNTIPFNAVERVETLKDGASSLYGADAIGGVVNVIMKSNFQGADAEASYGGTQHGGGAQFRFNAEAGYGDVDADKYNAYVDFEYQKDDRIRIDQRGFPFNNNDLTSIGGDNNNPQPGFRASGPYGYAVVGGAIDPVTHKATALIDPATGAAYAGNPLRTCGPDAPLTTDADGNNYCASNIATYGDHQPKQERIGGYGRFTVKPTDHLEAYLSGSIFQNKVDVNNGLQQVVVGSPHNTVGIALPQFLPDGSLNPMNPYSGANPAYAGPTGSALINYGFGDIPSKNTYTNRVYRMAGGVKGDALGWDYNSTLVIAHSSLETRQEGFISYNALIDVITNGTYNFMNPSANSQAVRDKLAPVMLKTSTTDLDSIDFNATRQFGELRGGPIGVAFGGQFRYEATEDPNINPFGDTQGLGSAQTRGNRTVASAFGEIGLPVLESLELNLSGRYDHYSDVGGNFSPKLAAKWTPIKTLALRATYSKGFRAPSFSEGGDSASIGFTNSQGLPASFIALHPGSFPNGGNAYTQTYAFQLNTTANPDIKPEKSESYTFGGVWAPNRHFSTSLDYYHIDKKDVIAALTSGPALAAYYAGQPIPPGYTITPDAPDPLNPTALPRVLSVGSPYVNADSLSTSGMDWNIRTDYDLPWGEVRWTSELDATVIFNYDFTIAGVTSNYVGKQSPYALSSGAGTPKYRGVWTNSFAQGPWRITGAVNYVSGQRSIDADSGPECLYDGGTEIDNKFCHSKAFIDLDLTGSYDINDKVQLQAAVLNATDEGPQFNPANYAGVNYNPTFSQAGLIGRFFRVGVKMKY
ncbi:TonB-dependent receptor [Caulobacter sp. Root487D2Y]|uniref:TonB-dependent receptor plug domain-containing protein n=1 Tax=Caulobacter sp. Root487D2Y TaxID=1736547 RepID=UPI0006FA480D|nr:TonB-dependent receptor [Caulobacter sp. Root487D2Y]KQY27666.1 TonB-dependent receptor [Caulobacter sp. Root487D2Y]